MPPEHHKEGVLREGWVSGPELWEACFPCKGLLPAPCAAPYPVRAWDGASAAGPQQQQLFVLWTYGSFSEEHLPPGPHRRQGGCFSFSSQFRSFSRRLRWGSSPLSLSAGSGHRRSSQRVLHALHPGAGHAGLPVSAHLPIRSASWWVV